MTGGKKKKRKSVKLKLSNEGNLRRLIVHYPVTEGWGRQVQYLYLETFLHIPLALFISLKNLTVSV